MAFERVADESGLRDGGLLGVKLQNGEEVCLAKVHGQLFAIKDECTHAKVPLSGGELGQDYCVECPLHGGKFDLRDGTAKEAPAKVAVKTFSVKVEDGGIWVSGSAA